MADEPSDSMPENDNDAPDLTPEDSAPAYNPPSKSQLDQLLAAARKRERDRFADYDALKAKAAKLDEIEAENQSELERERAAREAAEARANEILERAKETTLRAEILAEAAKPDRRVIDPEAVVALLDRSELELDDNGAPSNIAEAMDRLLEKRPYLVAQDGGTRAGGADQGARAGGVKGQLTRDALKSMTPEQIVAARREGRTARIEGRI